MYPMRYFVAAIVFLLRVHPLRDFGSFRDNKERQYANEGANQ